MATYEPYIEIREAAAHLGVCTRTIRRYVARGILKSYQFGGTNSPLKFKLSEIEAATSGLAAMCKG